MSAANWGISGGGGGGAKYFFSGPKRPPRNEIFPALALKTITSLNKEVRPFFLSDNSIWSFPSASSRSDYSIWRS